MDASPLKWLGAIAAMAVVVLVTLPLLFDAVGGMVRLDTGQPDVALTEFPTEAVVEPTAPATEQPSGEASEEEFPQSYTVESGDTGAAISDRFYGSPDGWPAIAEANGIDPSAPLRVGVELEIPPPP